MPWQVGLHDGSRPRKADLQFFATREPLFTTALVGTPPVQRHMIINLVKDDHVLPCYQEAFLQSHPCPVNTSIWYDKYCYGSGTMLFCKQNLVLVENHLLRWQETMRPSGNIVLGLLNNLDIENQRVNLDIENSCRTELRLLANSEFKQQDHTCHYTLLG